MAEMEWWYAKRAQSDFPLALSPEKPHNKGTSEADEPPAMQSTHPRSDTHYG